MPSITVQFNNELVLNQELTKEVYIIGRTDDCDIQIDNLGISRNHARLLQNGPFYTIEDMNSSNGTFVNGQRVTRFDLHEGDEIVIGKYILTYRQVAHGSEDAQAEKKTISANVPGSDSLHTMAMDGDAIRKRIEEMKKQKETEAAVPSPLAQAAAESAEATKVAEAEARAKAAELAQMRQSMIIMKLLVLLVVLGAAAAAVYFFVLNGGNTPPPAP